MLCGFRRWTKVILQGLIALGFVASCSYSPKGTQPVKPDLALKLFSAFSTLQEENTCKSDSQGTPNQFPNDTANAEGGKMPVFSWENPVTPDDAQLQSYALVIDSDESHLPTTSSNGGCSPSGPQRCVHLVLYNIPPDATSTAGLNIENNPQPGGTNPAFGVTYSRAASSNQPEPAPQPPHTPRTFVHAYDGPCPWGYAYQIPSDFKHDATSGKTFTYTAELFALNSPITINPIAFQGMTREQFQTENGPFIIESAKTVLYYTVP